MIEDNPLPASVLHWYIEPVGSTSKASLAALLKSLGEEPALESLKCADGDRREMLEVSPYALVVSAVSANDELKINVFGDEGQGIIAFKVIVLSQSKPLNSPHTLDSICKEIKAASEDLCLMRQAQPPRRQIPDRGVRPWNACKSIQPARKIQTAGVHRLRRH